jgi:hypothetical protein
MKIFVLPVPEAAQPPAQAVRYPMHNADYGVEQDFLGYLEKNPAILAATASEADVHYLPIFWTRYLVNNADKLAPLADMATNAIVDASKTFTICQHQLGAQLELGEAVIYFGSRNQQDGFDVPLLTSPHRRPLLPRKPKYLASFMGRFSTHPMRGRLHEILGQREDMSIVDAVQTERSFVDNLLSAHVTLAPRGTGGTSFRFFEAMQLGRVPCLIGDIDTRPFKSQIDWDQCSLYCDDVEKIEELLAKYDNSQLRQMGKAARSVYRTRLDFGRFPPLLLKEIAQTLACTDERSAS